MVETDTLEKPETDADEREDDWLYCAVCGLGVTRERYAISQRGAHEHTVFNPMGVVFTIRCFGEADGAGPIADASKEFTWFPGYAWRIALCRACATHLGWQYDGTDRFFGLIKRALTRSPQ